MRLWFLTINYKSVAVAGLATPSGLTSNSAHPRKILCIRLLLQVVHIFLTAQPEKQVQARVLLYLVFFFTEKRKVLGVEVLRQWGNFFNRIEQGGIRPGMKL